MRLMSRLRLALGLLALSAPLEAQLYQGVVRDTISLAPIAGVVVSVIDSTGKPFARTLSAQNGAYRLAVPSMTARLRVQRIGYRMREIRLVPSTEETATLDIALVALPSLLDPVRVIGAAACPKRRDNAGAQALYEQARAGLLATIVARETNPGSVVRYAYDRPVMLWPDSAPVRVRIDSTRETTVSFRSPFSGDEFVRFGFQRKIGDHWQYFGPDADVLLDEGFANGYCFSIADRDRTRRSQIGLSFAAATKQKGRVDIVGTLWIDTVARELRTIEYKYTGAGGLAGYLDTGGRTSFLQMPNGIVAVTQWSVRLLNSKVDSVQDKFGNQRSVRSLVQSEGGGYLAKASWPDGTSWLAPMGTARLRLMLNDTTPLVANEVSLAGTDYRAKTDSSGLVRFRDLFPGRYSLVVRDTLLEELGWEPEPQFDFIATAGGMIDAGARVQTTAELLLRKCVNRTSRSDLVAVVNVKDAAVAAGGVKVELNINNTTITETTAGHGTIVFCFDRNALGVPLTVVGERGDMRTQTIAHVLNRRVTLFRLQLAPKPPLPRDTIPRDPD
jgi:hypothetical protein